MKIHCEREKLMAAFQLAATLAPARSPKEILQNIKLDATMDTVVLMATDMDAGIRIAVDGIRVLTPGKALLPVQRFGSILRESSDEGLTLETEESSLVIRGDRSEFKLPSPNPDEFPTVMGFEETSFHEVSARLFREMIRRTIFATDAESSRYALGGVLLEMSGDEVIAVGTDGRRLSRMQGQGTSVDNHRTTGSSTIIPTKTLGLLERCISDKDDQILVAARPNDALFKTSRCIIFSRLVEGRFPNWRQVIPSRNNPIVIVGTVGPFYAALRQASVVADPESRGVDFQFGEGSLVITARTAEVGQSRIELPIAYDGEPIKLTMDHRFVADFLKVLDPESSFTMEASSPSEPALFLTQDGYAYVVMPMARER
jgi:DNA polymerase-3 subunit beta